MLEKTVQAFDLSANERRKLLRDDRCQHVLALLAEQTPPVDCMELAELVACREEGTDETDDNAVARVTTSLRYTQLPMLSEWGLIEFNPETNTIEPRERTPANLEGEQWEY